MVSKNRIKVMLIYIFLAIYISIGTVNVYAASGDSPENFITNMGDDKSYESQQLGNCDGQDYAVGNVTIPSLEINPIVVSNTTSWGEDDFETWLRE